jgi:hypothetical protein
VRILKRHDGMERPGRKKNDTALHSKDLESLAKLKEEQYQRARERIFGGMGEEPVLDENSYFVDNVKSHGNGNTEYRRGNQYANNQGAEESGLEGESSTYRRPYSGPTHLRGSSHSHQHYGHQHQNQHHHHQYHQGSNQQSGIKSHMSSPSQSGIEEPYSQAQEYRPYFPSPGMPYNIWPNTPLAMGGLPYPVPMYPGNGAPLGMSFFCPFHVLYLVIFSIFSFYPSPFLSFLGKFDVPIHQLFFVFLKSQNLFLFFLYWLYTKVQPMDRHH